MSKRKILVPLDGSKFSREIFAVIRSNFKPESVELILFEALDPVSSPPLDSELITASEMVTSSLLNGGEEYKRRLDQRDTRHYQREHATQYQHKEALLEHASSLTEAGYAITVAAEIGEASEQIVAYAHKAGIDLIAMTTHGRSGLSKLILGSVAERVLRESSVPVLLVRPEDRCKLCHPPEIRQNQYNLIDAHLP